MCIAFQGENLRMCEDVCLIYLMPYADDMLIVWKNLHEIA